MKNLSRSEIFSMLALPLIAVAVRKLESKLSPINFAISRPPESRKVKLPCLRLTRRTSGVNGAAEAVVAVVSLGDLAATGAREVPGCAMLGTDGCAGAGTTGAVDGRATIFTGGNAGK